MALGDRVMINGTYVHSWSSIEVVVANIMFSGFVSLAFDDKREHSLVYGLGKSYTPRGMTAGKYTPSPAKLAGALDTMAQLRTALAAKAQVVPGQSWGGVGFDIVVHVMEPGSPPITSVVQGCRVSSVSNSWSESPDQLVEEWELVCLAILRDGQSLADKSLFG